MRHLRLLLACGVVLFLGAAPPAPPAELKRGDLVRVLHAQTLLFYGKPWGIAKAGSVMEVLDVRLAAHQVFVAVKDNGRVIAVSLPLEAIRTEKDAKKADRVEQSTALFAGLIPTLNVKLEPEALENLKKEPKKYVEGTIEETGFPPHEHLGIKLKGSAGSFQQVDQRPGFSINCTKFDGGDRFHGIRRFQLNNCAQDGTALNEPVAGEMARTAGVPASRCTHALVSINGRPLGIYVLKEGFTEEFLAAFFKETDGHLYDGGFVSDIQPNMELDRGDPEHQEALARLVAALQEGDEAKQFQQVSALVDVDAYLRYLALESIMCHWDGYSFNKNNYRIYEDPEQGKFHFILHGMDQMFGDAKMSVERPPTASVGSVLLRHPEIRERYWTQLLDVYNKVIKPINWPARVQEQGRRLLAALPKDQAGGYQPHIAEEADRVAARLAEVKKQVETPRIEPILAAKGAADLKLGAWTSQAENATADEAAEDRRPCLHLKATGDASASWRLNVTAPAGRFRFSARVKSHAVEAAASENGSGGGLRVSGSSRQGQKFVQGTMTWQVLTYDFDSNGQGVTLIAELRAKAGEVWFDKESLHLARIP